VSRRPADFWSGLALAALGTYIIVQARQWEYLGADGPGPGFFPLWYGIAMTALSGLLVVSSASRGQGADGGGIAWRGIGRALAVWAALAASVAAFKLVGFVVSFAALTFFIVAALYRRRLVVAAAAAAGTAAGFHVLFPVVLGVQLPVGLLGF